MAEKTAAELEKEKETAPVIADKSNERSKCEHLFRFARVEADSADDEERTLQVAFSSETPVLRKARKSEAALGIAKEGEQYWELLSHRKADADFSELNTGDAPVLLEHDGSKQVGNVKRAKLSKDKIGRAVLQFDGISDQSKTTYEQMKSGKRRGISFGYYHTRFIGDDGEKDGHPIKRIAFAADEITSTFRPADTERAGVRRSVEGQWSCLSCGDMFDRADLDDDFECGCSLEKSGIRSPESRVQSEEEFRNSKARKADDFKFTRADGDISFNTLRQLLNVAVDSDKRFKAKRPNGDIVSCFYIADIILADGDWQAIVITWGPEGKTFCVEFELTDYAVTLGEASEVEQVVSYEPVGRSERSEVGGQKSDKQKPAVDSTKLSTAETRTQTKEFMADKTPEQIAAETTAKVRAEIEPQIRTEVQKTTRTEVATALRTRSEQITKRADEFIKDHGKKQRGAMTETIRKVTNEFLTRDNGDKKDGEVLAEFGQRCLEEIAKVKPEPYLLRERVSEREYQQYSLGRAIRSAIQSGDKERSNRGMPTDFELDVHNDIVKRAKEEFGTLGFEAQGFQVPFDAPTPAYSMRRTAGGRMTRDLFTGDFGSGGAMVPTTMVLPVIELLRNRLVLAFAGARTLGGLQGNIVIPRQTSASAPAALGEIAQLVASQPTFDQIEGKPRRVGNTVNYSKQLLLQSSPDVEALVRDDNFKEIALKIDYLGLNGQGVNSEPLGVMHQPGIGSINFGAAATYAKIVSMETAIRKANVYDPIVYLSTSNTRGVLRTAPATLTGSTVVSGSTNAIWTGMGGNEEVNGRPAFDSQQIPLDQVVAGAFEHLLHMMWGGLDVVVDNLTLADKAEIKLTFNTWNDFAVRHPQAFCISNDSGAQ